MAGAQLCEVHGSDISEEDTHYANLAGLRSTREALARFLTAQLAPAERIEADEVRNAPVVSRSAHDTHRRTGR